MTDWLRRFWTSLYALLHAFTHISRCRLSKWTYTWSASVMACPAVVRWRRAGRRCPHFVRSATAWCGSTAGRVQSWLWRLVLVRAAEVRTSSWCSGGFRSGHISYWRRRESRDALTLCFYRSRPTTVRGITPQVLWARLAATATVPPEVRSVAHSHIWLFSFNRYFANTLNLNIYIYIYIYIYTYIYIYIYIICT